MSSQTQARTLDGLQEGAADTKPTTPSFIDRFMDLVEGLPGPYWLAYAVLFVLQSLAMHVLAWMVGWLSPYTLNPLLLMFPLWLWGPLAIMAYLNSISLEAVEGFRPLLDIDEEGIQRLKDEFTTMPARGVILNGVFWSIIYVVLTALTLETLSVSLGLGPLLTLVLVLEGFVSYVTGSAIYYHSLRQLRLVNRTVKMVKQVNLFHLDPVYAFSRLTARTGAAWMVLLSLTLLTYPMQLANAPVFTTLAVQVVLALAAFVLPLRFVNDRLVAEKRKLVAELDGRVERTLKRLHHHLDRDDMREIEQLNDAIAALNAERDILIRIPTWPWRAGTLTSFVSAIVLPIVLFLIQLVIQNWLGG